MEPEKSKRKGLPRRFSPYVYAGLGMLLGIGLMAFVGVILLKPDFLSVETSLTGRTDTETPLPINDIDLSPDGKRLVVAYKPDTESDNTSILVRDFDDDFILQPGITTIVENGKPVQDVIFMPDGKRILASPDGHPENFEVHLYDLNGDSWDWDGQYVTTSPDGSLIAIAFAYKITYYDGNSGQLLSQFEDGNLFYRVALSPNAEILAVVTFGAENSAISFYDTPYTPDDAPEYPPEDHMSDKGAFTYLLFTPQGDRIVARAGFASMLYHNLMLDGATLGGTYDALENITRLAVSGSWLAIAGTEGVQLLHYETRPGWTTLQWMDRGTLDTKNVTGAVFTPDERYLLTSHADGIVRLWDFREGVEVKSWSM